MADEYRSILEEVGVGGETQHVLFVTNPAKFLAMADGPRRKTGGEDPVSEEQSKETT
jgi:hypothetical protein